MSTLRSLGWPGEEGGRPVALCQEPAAGPRVLLGLVFMALSSEWASWLARPQADQGRLVSELRAWLSWRACPACRARPGEGGGPLPALGSRPTAQKPTGPISGPRNIQPLLPAPGTEESPALLAACPPRLLAPGLAPSPISDLISLGFSFSSPRPFVHLFVLFLSPSLPLPRPLFFFLFFFLLSPVLCTQAAH